MLDTRPNLDDSKFEQCSGDQLSLSGTTDFYGILNIKSGTTLNILDNAGNGKVLTSDALGSASWTDITAYGGNNSIQFNNNGFFSGTSNLEWYQNNEVLCIDGSAPTIRMDNGSAIGNIEMSVSGYFKMMGCESAWMDVSATSGGRLALGNLLATDTWLSVRDGSTSPQTTIMGLYSGGTVIFCADTNGSIKMPELPSKTSETCGLYIDASGSLSTGVVGGSAASGERIVKEVSQASHGFSVGEFIGWSGGTYTKAIADGSYDGEFIGLVNEVPDTGTFSVTQAGYVSGLTSLVQNTTYYLSSTVEGQITATEPTGNTEINKAVLIADSTTSGWVLPYAGFVISTGGTSSGTITGGTNGLTTSDDNIELGGTLCKTTSIAGAGNTFLIGVTTSKVGNSGICGSGDTRIVGNDTIICGNENVITVCNSQPIKICDSNSTPMEYAADYSANIGSRSIPDVGWVTANTGIGNVNWNGATSNAIGTYVDSETICAEPNLKFNGSILEITGDVRASSQFVAKLSTYGGTDGQYLGEVDTGITGNYEKYLKFQNVDDTVGFSIQNGATGAGFFPIFNGDVVAGNPALYFVGNSINGPSSGTPIIGFDARRNNGAANASDRLFEFGSGFGDAKMVIMGDGKVGVNYESTAPSYTFDVDGDGRFTGQVITNTLQIQSGAAAGCVLTSDASGKATWETPTDTNY